MEEGHWDALQPAGPHHKVLVEEEEGDDQDAHEVEEAEAHYALNGVGRRSVRALGARRGSEAPRHEDGMEPSPVELHLAGVDDVEPRRRGDSSREDQGEVRPVAPTHRRGGECRVEAGRDEPRLCTLGVGVGDGQEEYRGGRASGFNIRAESRTTWYGDQD